MDGSGVLLWLIGGGVVLALALLSVVRIARRMERNPTSALHKPPALVEGATHGALARMLAIRASQNRTATPTSAASTKRRGIASIIGIIAIVIGIAAAISSEENEEPATSIEGAD